MQSVVEKGREEARLKIWVKGWWNPKKHEVFGIQVREDTLGWLWGELLRQKWISLRC